MPRQCLSMCLKGVAVESPYGWRAWGGEFKISFTTILLYVDVYTNYLMNSVSSSVSADGRFTSGRSYSNEQLVVSLDDCNGCRAGLTIRDLESFHIWCQAFNIYFTSLNIPANLFNVSQNKSNCITWYHIMCHMMSHDISCGITWCVTCHMMSHDVSLVWYSLVFCIPTASWGRCAHASLHLWQLSVSG